MSTPIQFKVRSSVEYLTNSEIESITNNLLSRYVEAGGEINHPPIPIEFVVEDFLGYQIISDNFADRNTLAYVDPNTKTICWNHGRPDYFDEIGFEFTLAHEVGHVELGHFEKIDKQLNLDFENSPAIYLHRESIGQKYARHEYQAEYFASCLLMPKDLIIQTTHDIDLLAWKSLYELAPQFSVSITAFTKRLQSLGLIFIKDKRIYHDKNEASGMRRLF